MTAIRIGARVVLRAHDVARARAAGGLVVPPTNYNFCPSFWGCNGGGGPSAGCPPTNTLCSPGVCDTQG
jgi:hypothetical protein